MIDIKDLAYILFIVVGSIISYYVYYVGGDYSYFCVLTGFWTGYFGHMILNWGNKNE